MLTRTFAGGAALAVLTLAAAPAAYAQAVTGGVSGRVINEAGQPVAGATVVVTHVPTGTATTTTTDGQGRYSALNQRVGGPYSVSVRAKGFADETISVETVAIGDPTAADLTLHAASQVKEVTVTGVRTKSAMAPRTRIAQAEIQTLPSENRDLKDFARKSPYVVLDPTNSNALIINGQNNRTNLITIDGIKQTDTFGLNGNGYPTQRTPISLSVVQTLQVEVAPYDVIYGDFQGGTVNVVTKSGSNDFHGEAFYEYENNRLRGGSFFAPGATKQTNFTSGFNDKTWGVTLTGPIWKDHAFFVLNYENFTANQPSSNTGPSDSNAATKVIGVTQSEVDQVINVMQSAYHYNPLSWQQANLPTIDHKFFGKLDWNINNDHRLVFEYQKTDGNTLNSTSSGSNSCSVTSTSKPCLPLLSKWYTLQTNLEVYKAQLFSHWTDRFTTELSYSHQEADNLSNPLTAPFAEMQVFLPGTVFSTSGSTKGSPICTTASPCPSIVLGTDISRQANQLIDKIDQVRLKGDYRWNGMTFTAGYELQKVDVYNVFVQRAIGQYIFNCIAPNGTLVNGAAVSCADVAGLHSDLQSQVAYQDQYSNAADGNASEAAGRFTYNQHTLYFQDEWAVLPNLNVRAGVRDDFYTSGSRPNANAAFDTAYGYPNTKNLNGMSVLQPRFGFNYRPFAHTQVYGGYGLFQGGTPLVWISNIYSNPGNVAGFVSCNQVNWMTACPGDAGDPFPFNGVTGHGPSGTIKDQNGDSVAAGQGNTNAIAPGTEPASLWKGSIGVAQDFDLDRFWLGKFWRARAEFVNDTVNNALVWQDVYMQDFLSGTAPDGRPEYFAAAAAGGKTPFGSASRQNRTDVVIEDTHQGHTQQWTVSLGKDWRTGPLQGLSFDLSYTNTIDKEVNPGASSVATSSYRQVAFSNPNSPGLAHSNYEIRDLTKLIVEYDHKWFWDSMTRIGIYAQKRSGLPFSYTFQDATAVSGAASTGAWGMNNLYATTNAELLYVPKLDPATHTVTATSDPLVTYKSGFDFAGFNKFLTATGLVKDAGQISPRNGFRSREVTTVDFHFGQEIPALLPSGSKLEAYMDILNLGNMLNNHWGVIEQASFPYLLSPIAVRNCQAAAAAGCAAGTGNFYQFDSFTAKSESANFNSSSVWQIKIGFRYKF